MSAVKDDLVVAVQSQLAANGVTANKKDTETMIAAVFAGLTDTIQSKESVRTAIGTFRWAHVEARDRINPRTSETVHVPAYSTMKFKVGKSVRVNDADKVAKKAPAKAAAKPAAKAPVKAPVKAAAAPAAKAPVKAPLKKPVAKK
jgi:nucleoid DNA-binding protein